MRAEIHALVARRRTYCTNFELFLVRPVVHHQSCNVISGRDGRGRLELVDGCETVGRAMGNRRHRYRLTDGSVWPDERKCPGKGALKVLKHKNEREIHTHQW